MTVSTVFLMERSISQVPSMASGRMLEHTVMVMPMHVIKNPMWFVSISFDNIAENCYIVNTFLKDFTMKRKILSIIVLVAALLFTVGNLALTFIMDEQVYPEDTVCYQLPVEDGCKPEAITYNKTNGAQHWKDQCSNIMAKAGQTNWIDHHPVVQVGAGIGVIILVVVGIVILCAVLFFIIAPTVVLVRWSFEDRYKDYTYREAFHDILSI